MKTPPRHSEPASDGLRPPDNERSTALSYFEDMYATDDDPWHFETSRYERRKYAITLASLPEDRYHRALEAGCANGSLTSSLASFCDRLHAFDFYEPAVRRAQQRTSTLPHVSVVQAQYPDHWPGPVDLVVWSEVAYYLNDADAARAIRGLDRYLATGGDLVCVHYTGATNYPRPGSDIGPWLDDVGFIERIVTHDDRDFTLGIWRRCSA